MQNLLENIVSGVKQDQGLRNNVSNQDINDGTMAARSMNEVILEVIQRTGVNGDGEITPADLKKISIAIQADDALYQKFLEGHGNDEGNVETGFHLVQGDGATDKFQGRNYVNTVADAIYHLGFEFKDGRILNEDGNANEQLDDIAGWLNYFLNGTNIVYGSSEAETLHSGQYSSAFADAADEIFKAGDGDDKIWAGDGNDEVRAGNGNDRSGGGKGDDLMFGQNGDDKLYGEAGNDKIYGGIGDDVVGGGAGDDQLYGSAGEDKLWGDQGDDYASGGEGNDVIGGGAGDDKLTGGSGDDKLWGEGGKDLIFGGDGNDIMTGGSGEDKIYAGRGNDKAWGDDGIDIIYGGAGDDTLGGNNGADKIYGGGDNDTIYGGDGSDEAFGNSGDDTIHGNDGNDSIYGNSGDDKLLGGDGNDMLKGGNGVDEILAGNGRDVLEGGKGADELKAWEDVSARDIFVFNQGDSGRIGGATDKVFGFESREDKIDLSSFDDLVFIDGDEFGGTGQAEVLFDGDFVSIDVNGDGRSDMDIELVWVNEVVASDFILA